MEKEFKYKLSCPEQINEIISDSMLDPYVNRESIEDVDMHAVYFDTAELDLKNAGIAYRIRYEDDRILATIKWDKDRASEGFHQREEFNLVINDEAFARNPNVDAFESSDAHAVLYKAVGKKKLVPVIEMEYNRKLIKINTGKSISALSFDNGVIHGLSGDQPVLEMEVEWYFGDEEEFKKITTKLAEAHSLQPENRSKLQRGFE